MINSSLIHILDSYLASMALSKASKTVEAYASDLRQLLSYLGARKINKATNIRRSHIESFLGHAKSLGRSDATLNRYYMSARSFAGWLSKNRMTENFAMDITKPKMEVASPRIPTREEMIRLLNSPDTESWQGIRDRALLEMLYGSGLRASELCDLKDGDIHLDKVFIAKGKGSKARTVPITHTASFWVEQYIERCREDDGTPWLWQRMKGDRLTRSDLFDIVTRYARMIKLQAVTPHTLRHACATHLIDAGADIRMIQIVLGHSSISSTQRYTHLSSQSVSEMFKKFHPGAHDDE